MFFHELIRAIHALATPWWVDLASIVTALATLALVVAAFRALGQISLTRETVAIDELRHFEQYLTEEDILIRKILNKSKALEGIEMWEFNFFEAASEKYKKKISEWHKFYKENPDLLVDARKGANKLEVIATALKYGTAKLDIIENSIAVAFCGSVEFGAYVYILYRNEGINLYINTIDLYRKLKPKIGTLASQIEKVEKETKRILETK